MFVGGKSGPRGCPTGFRPLLCCVLDGLECSTVRVRRARACVDNPRHHAWFPNNVARNSPATISDFENASLELQRLRGVSKTDRYKLRATFGGGERRGKWGGDQCEPRPRQASVAGAEALVTAADHVRPQKRPQPSPTTCAPATRAPTPPGPGKPATASSRRKTPTRPPPPTRNE